MDGFLIEGNYASASEIRRSWNLASGDDSRDGRENDLSR
jgi:hypothetical protein